MSNDDKEDVIKVKKKHVEFAETNLHFGVLQLAVSTVSTADHNSPGGVLGILSDGDDRKIFLGLKLSIPGFFWGTKIWQVSFGVA